MRIVDNVNDSLGDDLKAEMKPGSRLRIAASTFSMYAFEALRNELEQIEELRFIFTSPTFVKESATDQLPKARREFFIPHASNTEATLYGSEFEIRLRNKMTQRAIARECAAWVRGKVRFCSNTTAAPMQQFAVVDDRAAYLPLQGFTSADLGYERGDAVSNMVTKVDEAPMTSQYVALFDQIWHNAEQLQDVTAAVHDHIASVYAENSPARIYFLILHNLFAEFLDVISEDVLPNDRTGYQDTAIWKALYNFQRDAATGVINKLETYNGCILADSVGLGKTFTALAVIKYYELRNKSVLVLAPKKLADNWTNYNANLTTNLFASDRFNYDVLAHTDLLRTRGESLGIPLDRVNWGNYDLVVIDESHNFRNADFSTEKESRYQRLMRQVIQQGVKTKVLMLSATPVNNHFTDLRNQLALAYEGDSEQLASKVGIATTVEEVFRQAQRVFNEWSKLPVAERTTDTILARLNFDFFELLDAVTIARSRKHIEAFYDTSDIGAFPDRLPPISIRSPLTDLPEVPSFNALFDSLSSLTLAVYAPLAYVFPSRLEKYEEQYGNVAAGRNTRGGAVSNLGQASRERGIQKLMTVNLLKRLESSVEAFRLTLGRLQATVGDAIQSVKGHDGSFSDLSMALSELDPDDDDFDVQPGGTVGTKVKIDLADMDLESFRRDLDHDAEVIAELLVGVRPVTPEHDLKLQSLTECISDAWTPRLADAVGEVLACGEFPVVLGGDCSILLGSMLALRRRGRGGLLFIDGHADFYQAAATPTGEAASMDLALACGHGPGLLCDLEGRRPLVRSADCVAFAYRDAAEQARYGSQPLPRDLVAYDLGSVRRLGAATAARLAVAHLQRPELDGFFIHLDADCLDDALMPAVDYRLPGGLAWDELRVALASALASGRALGLEVTIYNPTLDPDGVAGRRLVEVLAQALGTRAPGAPVL